MNITVTSEKQQDNKVSAHVVVAVEDVNKAVAKTYKEFAHKYSFQGFRRGRAPRAVIDSMVGKEAVFATATNALLQEVEPLVLEELDIVPVGSLSFGDDPAFLVEGTEYTVDAIMSVRPECELSSYDAPAINMPPAEATEAEVDWQLNQLLQYQVTYVDLEEDRAVAADDIVLLTIKNLEGASFLEAEGRMVMLGQSQLPEDLEQAVVGMTKGETKEVEWTRSAQNEEKSLSHTFKVEVTVDGLKQKHLPELSDELAKTFGFDDLAALREAVKGDIERDKVTTLPNLKEDRVVEALGKTLLLDEVPEDYQNQIFNELASEFLATLQRQNMSLDMFLASRGVKTDDFISDLKAQAEERARQSLALDALAAHLKFEAADSEVLAEFEQAGVENPVQFMEQWKREGRLPAVRESIKRTKALKWMAEHAEVTIVDEVAERMAAEDSAN